MDIAGACDELRTFCDALTNWYVRRSRSRFWDEDRDAIDTLHTVLEVVTRLAAPLLPLATEVIWRGLTGERSVHLPTGPPRRNCPPIPRSSPRWTRSAVVCSTVLSLRKAQHLRVRLPLPLATVATPGAAHLEPFVDLIKDEVNVKKVVTTDDVEAHGRFEIAVNARVAGPRLGKDVQTGHQGSQGRRLDRVRGRRRHRSRHRVAAGGVHDAGSSRRNRNPPPHCPTATGSSSSTRP